MQTTTIKLVTIIAEGVLRERITSDLLRLGARGYTYHDVHGQGTRGIAEQFWEGSQVRIESVMGAAAADAVLHHLQETYFADYSVMAYATDVQVVRPEKYA